MACFRSAVLGGLRDRALTRLGKDILLMLSGYGRCGSIWPSHATIADRVTCSLRAVRRTLGELRDAGWLNWQRRYRRAGAYLRRTSNLYTLAIPRELRCRPTGLRVSRVKTEVKKQGLGTVAEQLAALGLSPGEVRNRLDAIRKRPGCAWVG